MNSICCKRRAESFATKHYKIVRETKRGEITIERSEFSQQKQSQSARNSPFAKLIGKEVERSSKYALVT